MLRYGVSNLGPETSPENLAKLLAALKTVKGIKDVELVPAKREITFGINGPEPRPKLLLEACASAGFKLGSRM